MGLFKTRNNKQPSQYLLDSYSMQGRRDNQEDSYLAMTSPWGEVLVLVADGVGGYAHGEFASQTVRDIFQHSFAQMSEFGTVESYIRKTIFVAATMLMQKGMINESYKDAATTVTGFIITQKNELYVFNVGDSRVYLYRDGHLQRITKDHSLVQQLVDEGQISQDQAFSHPDKHILTNMLSSRISDLRIDIDKKGKVQAGDIIFASSDGFHDYVRDEEIKDFLDNYKGKESLARALCQWAYEQGSTDNITVVTCQRII